MKATSSLVLPARLENLQPFLKTAKEAAAEAGLGPEEAYRMELALEEALVNIINYAYEGGEGEIRILCASDDNGTFVTEITDNGRPFVMSAVPPPDLASGVDERRIGGLGIHLMKSLVDEVSYRREEEKNVLSLRISLASPEV